MSNIISAENLSHFWADTPLFNNLSLGIDQGEKVALVARNGAGKTTLLNILAGLQLPLEGKVTLRDGVKIGYLTQEPGFNEGETVLGAIFNQDNPLLDLLRDYKQALESNNQDDIGLLNEKMDEAGAWDFEARVRQILSRLDICDLEREVNALSGGELRRVALASVLVHDPAFLILDEPTNHLDVNMARWLEEYLARGNFTLLMVTHDRYFLDRICTTIFELDGGNLYRYNCNYTNFVVKREERYRLQGQEIEKARNLLRKEQDWMNRMPQARATKAKYRIQAFHDLKEVASRDTRAREMNLDLPSTRLGTKVVNLENVDMAINEKILLNSFSFKFVKGQKIGVIGKNGVGKSTLLNIITGLTNPRSGSVERGDTVVFGYYKQQNINIDNNLKVIEVVSEIADAINTGSGKVIDSAQLLRYFMFPNEMHHVRVGKLSGGEKKRLYLLTVLINNPNFLILDEPTNDLDIFTLEVLENYLAGFNGCALVVSHDRYFLDNVVDQLLVFKENGVVKHFPGNFSSYLEQENASKILTRQPATVKRQNHGQGNSSGSKPRGLTFKQRQELIQVEENIAKLETAKSDLVQLISSGNLTPPSLVEASNKLGALLAEIEQAETRWLELSEQGE